MRSNVIVVAACHRTGSGLVASMLSEMGVSMGLCDPKAAQSPDELWEDQDFVSIHRKMLREYVDGVYQPHNWQYPQPVINSVSAEAWRDLAKSRSQQYLWGFKDPRFMFLFDFGLGVLDGLGVGVNIVWLHRKITHSARSLQRRDGGTLEENLAIAQHQSTQWVTMRGRHERLHCLLSYESLLEDPMAGARNLAELVGAIRRTNVLTSTIEAAAGLVRSATV